eukprot:1883004-Amphidinium_carterae.1
MMITRLLPAELVRRLRSCPWNFFSMLGELVRFHLWGKAVGVSHVKGFAKRVFKFSRGCISRFSSEHRLLCTE